MFKVTYYLKGLKMETVKMKGYEVELYVAKKIKVLDVFVNGVQAEIVEGSNGQAMKWYKGDFSFIIKDLEY